MQFCAECTISVYSRLRGYLGAWEVRVKGFCRLQGHTASQGKNPRSNYETTHPKQQTTLVGKQSDAAEAHQNPNPNKPQVAGRFGFRV